MSLFQKAEKSAFWFVILWLANTVRASGETNIREIFSLWCFSKTVNEKILSEKSV